jgi:hypothetical protein
VKIVYFDHDHVGAYPTPFRRGEAGWVWMNAQGMAETDSRVSISANSLHALHGHGVVAQLNGLDLLIGCVGEGEPAVLSPSAASAATRIFYEADRMTYGGQHDLLVEGDSLSVEYRIVVDNREYQRTLSQLQFLASGAARMGHGVLLAL